MLEAEFIRLFARTEFRPNPEHIPEGSDTPETRTQARARWQRCLQDRLATLHKQHPSSTCELASAACELAHELYVSHWLASKTPSGLGRIGMSDSDLFHYQLEALAPLVFRSGKPFGVNAGADGAAFPLPSSLAGLLRSLWAEQQGQAFSPELNQIAAYGPLLAWREQDNTLIPLAPAPADAQYVTVQPDKQNGQTDAQQTPETTIRRRCPQPLLNTMGCDLAAGLLPVWSREDLEQNPGKPAPGPQYWPLAELARWSQGENICLDALNDNGLITLTDSVRTHVAIAPDSQAAADGQLFQTAGLDLAPQRQADGSWATRELVWLASTPKQLASRLATFGGERRLSRLHPLDTHAAPAHWLRPL